LAHAFIFSGPESIGKRLVSEALAAALNCLRPVDGDACGECADCTLARAGSHPNILEIVPVDKKGEPSASGVIRIEQVREVQAALRYRVEHGKKVVVVDQAEKFMPEAANAFLKTLEEPPADSIIILITSRAPELLPTILSRCHRVNFRPIPAGELAGALEREHGISGDDALALARLSGGSFGSALRYLSGGAHEKRREVLSRLGSLGAGDAVGALSLAEELSKRDDLDELLEFMKCWYRDRLVAAEGAGELVVNGDFTEYLHSGDNSSFSRLAGSYSMIENARRNITPPRYGNRQLTMEVLLLHLAGC
jgi:DNA polymerase-3 subunit delta'